MLQRASEHDYMFVLQTNNSVLYFDLSPHFPIPVFRHVIFVTCASQGLPSLAIQLKFINFFTISCYTFIHFVEKNGVNRSGQAAK